MSLDILAVSTGHVLTLILRVDYTQMVARERERERERDRRVCDEFMSIESVPS